MFWEVLDPSRIEVLQKIVEIKPVPKSYLAGETGLALMLGHRESVDFDWFTPAAFRTREIIDKLSMVGTVDVTESAEGTFHGFFNHMRVTWLHYPNPLVDHLLEASKMPGLRIASLKDIGLMKWIALSQRGARKDFVDLYWICQQGINLQVLSGLIPRKFPGLNVNYYHLVKSLSFFVDAEREPMPVMKKRLNWEDVKKYFKEIQSELLKDTVG